MAEHASSLATVCSSVLFDWVCVGCSGPVDAVDVVGASNNLG